MSRIGENTGLNTSIFDRIKTMKTATAQDKNRTNYISNFNYLCDIVCASYMFTGLPDDLKDKDWFIKRNLEIKGPLVLFREKETGHLLCLPGVIQGQPDVYGEYSGYMCYGFNGYSQYVRKEECAVCWATLNRVDTTLDIFETAERMTEIQRTCDVRLLHHKNPIIFVGDKKLSESYKVFWSEIINNEPSIVIDQGLKTTGASTSPVNFDSPFINKELYQYKMQIAMEFFQRRGINFNPETGKKERMVVAEVDSNNEAIEIARNIYLEPRREFCMKAREMFPECANMDVIWLSDKLSDDKKVGDDNDDNKKNS